MEQRHTPLLWMHIHMSISLDGLDPRLSHTSLPGRIKRHIGGVLRRGKQQLAAFCVGHRVEVLIEVEAVCWLSCEWLWLSKPFWDPILG